MVGTLLDVRSGWTMQLTGHKAVPGVLVEVAGMVAVPVPGMVAVEAMAVLSLAEDLAAKTVREDMAATSESLAHLTIMSVGAISLGCNQS